MVIAGSGTTAIGIDHIHIGMMATDAAGDAGPISERGAMEYRYGSHTVYNIEYHFVWVTKLQ